MNESINLIVVIFSLCVHMLEHIKLYLLCIIVYCILTISQYTYYKENVFLEKSSLKNG